MSTGTVTLHSWSDGVESDEADDPPMGSNYNARLERKYEFDEARREAEEMERNGGVGGGGGGFGGRSRRGGEGGGGLRSHAVLGRRGVRGGVGGTGAGVEGQGAATGW